MRVSIDWSRGRRRGRQCGSSSVDANTRPSASNDDPPNACTHPQSNHSQSNDPKINAPNNANETIDHGNISITKTQTPAPTPTNHPTIIVTIPAPSPENPLIITPNASDPVFSGQVFRKRDRVAGQAEKFLKNLTPCVILTPCFNIISVG